MRYCEVLGCGVNLYLTTIYLSVPSMIINGYRETKTKVKHHIPLTGEVNADLKELKKVNGDGFLFSLTGGDKPVTGRHLYNGLRKAFIHIGISEKEIEERGLNVHAWRHFCNTELQKGGLTIQKVQAVIGHKSERSTERYTHFNPLDFVEVTEIQAALLRKKPEKQEGGINDETENERPALTLVKIPEDEKRKQAS
jgi:integrase